jgi:uncharacterized protein (UPF0548 family)
MARLQFSPIDGTPEQHLAQAVGQQPTYSGGLDPQPGFDTLTRTLRLPRGELSFRRAGETILSWEMHRRAGMRVHATTPRAEPGSTAVLGLGLAGFRLIFPCRVREAYDEPNRIGFAYVTLPGHPECGIERFQVELAEDGSVHATITAVSRPATLLVALGGPVSRLAQRRTADRYLKVLQK